MLACLYLFFCQFFFVLYLKFLRFNKIVFVVCSSCWLWWSLEFGISVVLVKRRFGYLNGFLVSGSYLYVWLFFLEIDLVGKQISFLELLVFFGVWWVLLVLRLLCRRLDIFFFDLQFYSLDFLRILEIQSSSVSSVQDCLFMEGRVLFRQVQVGSCWICFLLRFVRVLIGGERGFVEGNEVIFFLLLWLEQRLILDRLV